MPSDAAIVVSAGVLLIVLIVWISVVDARRLIIPDALNLALAAGGLSYRLIMFGSFPVYSVAGAVCLLALLYLVRFLHERIRGTVGLGLGDVKMAGAAALWLQPLDLPLMLFLSSLTAIAGVLILHHIIGGVLGTTRLPFGPFIGLGLVAVWLSEAIPYSGFGFSNWF